MDKPGRLFTKPTIVVFSALGSTVFGSLLYAENLRTTGNSKYITPVILFGIVYSFLVYKLALILHMPIYYIFVPFHLAGGILMVGPFWKYHLGNVSNYQKRKILGPAVSTLIPVTLIILLNIYYVPHKLTAKEFQEATKIEAQKQMKNKLFVLNDSMLVFYDIAIPLLSSSYTFSTRVEDLNTVYNYKDYSKKRFSVVCMRRPFEDNEEFSLKSLENAMSAAIVAKECYNKPFKNMICGDYTREISDTAFVKGSVVMIKVGGLIYQYITQFVVPDRLVGDSVSGPLIEKIRAISQQ